MDIALSLLVLVAIALVVGGVVLLRRGRRRQAWLMLTLAAVMAMNVAIWTIPTRSGHSLISAAPSR